MSRIPVPVNPDPKTLFQNLHDIIRRQSAPIVNLLFLHNPAQWGQWVYRALTFLVISCPCALVISIPLSFFAGIGGASNAGVLVKGSNYLETLAQTKYVVFDKTGTLTKGVFEVAGVHHNTMEEAKILEYAALAESFSTHPISRSLKTAYGKEIDQNRVPVTRRQIMRLQKLSSGMRR